MEKRPAQKLHGFLISASGGVIIFFIVRRVFRFRNYPFTTNVDIPLFPSPLSPPPLQSLSFLSSSCNNNQQNSYSQIDPNFLSKLYYEFLEKNSIDLFLETHTQIKRRIK